MLVSASVMFALQRQDGGAEVNCMAVWWVFCGGVVEDCGSDDCRSGNSDDTSGECDGKRERELWNVPAPQPKWLMVGPRILQARDPLNSRMRVMDILVFKSCDL